MDHRRTEAKNQMAFIPKFIRDEGKIAAAPRPVELLHAQHQHHHCMHLMLQDDVARVHVMHEDDCCMADEEEDAHRMMTFTHAFC
jgi:hypothetical protein